jgi:hypothetical protein
MQLNFDLPEKRYLSQEDIEKILAQLESGKRYDCRSRIGVGLSYRDNAYFVHQYDEFYEEVSTNYSREELISFLKKLDLRDMYCGYWGKLLVEFYWSDNK